jgi:glycosyltransferase involved in cell wall biosynthesis
MKTKQIWLEATHLFKSPTRNKSGIGNYTENIIKGVIDLNTNNNYRYSIVANLFFTNKKRYITGIKSRDFSYLYSRFIPGKVWNQLLKKKLMPPLDIIHLAKPDLVVNFDFTAVPTTKKIKAITVIHDLAFLKYPQFVEEKNLRRLRKFVPEAIEKSSLIIAVSESTKRDIIEAYNIEANKIRVVCNAVDAGFYKPTKMTNEIKNKYKLPDEYFLYLGNIEPRKNIEGIISAYEMLPDKIVEKYKLVLAGGKGWNDEAIKNKLAYSPRRKDIVVTGYVDQFHAAAIYGSAKIFLFPSYYEGFGLPIIESMSCGTPVITADNSSLKEVGGDAALYVKADDNKALAKQISLLVDDDGLYAELVQKGQTRSKKFNWEDSSKAMLQAIDEVLKK